MGMIYYYHECEGAEARVRCERGEELRGMAGGRYYKNIMNCYLRKEETYPIYIHYAGEEYASPDEAIVSRLDWRTSWMHFICGGKGFFNGQPVQAGDAFVAWVNERIFRLSDGDLCGAGGDSAPCRRERLPAGRGNGPDFLLFAKKMKKAVAIVHSEPVATAFLSQSPCFLYFFDFGLADNMNKWLIDCERWAGWRNGLAKRRTILYN